MSKSNFGDFDSPKKSKGKIDDYDDATKKSKGNLDDFDYPKKSAGKIDDYDSPKKSKANINDYDTPKKLKGNIDDYDNPKKSKGKIDDYDTPKKSKGNIDDYDTPKKSKGNYADYEKPKAPKSAPHTVDWRDLVKQENAEKTHVKSHSRVEPAAPSKVSASEWGSYKNLKIPSADKWANVGVNSNSRPVARPQPR